MEPLRILYLIDELDVGGTEQQLLELLTALDRARWAPQVACFRACGAIAREIAALGIPVTQIPKRHAVDPWWFLRLLRFMRRQRPAIVQTFLFTANTWGRLAACLCRVPVRIACERNVDTWKGPIHHMVDRLLARCTTCLVVNAQAIAQFLQRHRVVHPDVRVIPNGVRLERFESLQPLLPRGPSRVIGFIGRLEPQKDPATALRAFAQVRTAMPDVRLRIVGDGSLRDPLRAEARRLGLEEAVEFVGATREVAGALAGLDLLLLSSTREGCANAILEAMAAGVPVVATAVGGTPELIEQGVTGLLASPRDPQALAERLIELLTNPAKAEAIRAAARARVREQFSVERMVEAHERLYQQLLMGHGTWDLGQGTGDVRHGTWDLGRGTRPMRVCYIIDDLGTGGAQRQLLLLLQHLDRAQIEPTVVSLSTEKTALGESIRALRIPVLTIAQCGAMDVRAFWRLSRVLRRGRFQIVQTCLFTADLYGRPAAWLAGVPVRISSVRSPEPDKPRHYVWADRWLAPLTHRFIVNADCVGGLLHRREGVPRGKIHHIANGVLLNGMVSRVGDGSAFVVGSVGRLEPEKDYEVLLRAFTLARQAHPALQLVLVGDGSLRPYLEALARRLQVAPWVEFAGHQEAVDRWLARMDCFALPSRYEGCSNALLEAMAAGLPVIATRIEGNAEVIEEGLHGKLVPPRDVEAMAGALLEVCRDPVGACAMGARARARVQERFSVARMARETMALYANLLSP